MRIALLTIPGIYGAYFARELQAALPDDEFLVLCQVDPPAPAESARQASPTPSARPDPVQLARKVYWKAYEVARLRMTPIDARRMWTRPNVVRTTDINDPANVERLRAFGPDLILIFGGRIVRPAVLETAGTLALNVHGGKLPEYRGANGVKWMLWRGDLERITATVHVAAAKVDAGDIVREATVHVGRRDSYRTIFARLHVAGVGAMIEAVEAIKAGTATFTPQAGPARTYKAKEWTAVHERAMDRRLRLAVEKRDMGPLERRVVFQAYRRLHTFQPALFEPRPSASTVLLYHHVAKTEHPYVRRLGITLTPEHFERHVRDLTARFDVVPFSAILERRDDPRAVALTFDDGFASIMSTVVPIIERYECPIKVYVCESLVDGGLLWLNKLSFLLDSLPPSELDVLMRASLAPAASRVGPPIFQFIEHFVASRTTRVIDEYFERLAPATSERLYLTDGEIRRLLDHPLVEIGSHTRHHLPQHCLDSEARHDEIVVAHRNLVARFGDRIEGFALPFGYREHFTPAVVAAIRQVDDVVVSAYGGSAERQDIQGEPEVRRVGVWGNLGTLWHQMGRTI